jgi:hypothetical protein
MLLVVFSFSCLSLFENSDLASVRIQELTTLVGIFGEERQDMSFFFYLVITHPHHTWREPVYVFAGWASLEFNSLL